MENGTSFKEFHILALPNKLDKSAFSVFFFLIYFISVVLNLMLLMVIYSDVHLHTPMYLFLCHLSFVDICYTTTTIPKLLHMLLSGNNTVSFIQCFSQMFFYFWGACIEVNLLLAMAYDRYIAICKPLRYAEILNKRRCVLLMVGIWGIALLNSLFITVSASFTPLCYSPTIKQFYCDFKAVIKLSCPGNFFLFVIFVEMIVFGFCSFACSLASYIKVAKVILAMTSKDGRRKAFSTCSSHIMVLSIFYGTSVLVYMIPPSANLEVLERSCTIFYTAVTPMLNPLLYSLRNKDVKRALMRLFNKCVSYFEYR
ncbi:PREDICTED: olfactory receptor 1M1-like [Nanorana parkeri]|uniref:olfactory receptor 1M1-like n=1 Tax=Nanorana parkeri TaxID=125878 RepID=UPI000854C831|nr:PREDICTED: olfactory receptor 1M1-like [Nanorana parkeri]